MKVIRTQAHEFDAQLNFDSHGLQPYFAADSQVKKGNGSVAGRFSLYGETWATKLSYQDSNIVHPGEETPQGTPFKIQTVREYRLKVKAQDGLGERKFTAHLRPRWNGMEAERRNGTTVEISLPDGFTEGVNVRVQGSNIAFDRYLKLLQLAMDSIGINDWYFSDPHQSSSIQDAEQYVRIHRDRSGPIHARDGPIWALGHVLENDRDGYRKIVQNDRDDHANQLPGYYHTVTLDPRRIQEAWPDHQLPKEIKHYYSREAHDRDSDDPLAHPKLGASYQANRWGETLHFTEENLELLERELEEAVHSVLQSAGIDTSPDAGKPPEERSGGVFFPDQYFEPELVEREPATVIDVAEVKQNQESIVVRYLADGISPVQEETLWTLMADGGRVSPRDIAEENDRHLGSVYRGLRKMDELIDQSYGEVALRSNYVADLVHSALQEARESVDRAARTAARVQEATERQFGEAMEKFVAWAERHGVDYRRDRMESLEIELPDDTQVMWRHGRPKGEAVHILRDGYHWWEKAGQDPHRFRSAIVEIDGHSFRARRFLNIG